MSEVNTFGVRLRQAQQHVQQHVQQNVTESVDKGIVRKWNLTGKLRQTIDVALRGVALVRVSLVYVVF